MNKRLGKMNSAAKEGAAARAEKARTMALELRRAAEIEDHHARSLMNLDEHWPLFLETLRHSRAERLVHKLLHHPATAEAMRAARAIAVGSLVIIASTLCADLFGLLGQ